MNTDYKCSVDRCGLRYESGNVGYCNFGGECSHRIPSSAPAPSPEPGKDGPGEQMWICPAAEGCTLSLKVSCHHKNPHTRKPHLCDVHYYNCPLCVPIAHAVDYSKMEYNGKKLSDMGIAELRQALVDNFAPLCKYLVDPVPAPAVCPACGGHGATVGQSDNMDVSECPSCGGTGKAAPAVEPAPVDVGEGYERVPDGTVKTADMEMNGSETMFFWHRIPLSFVGGLVEDDGLVYRRRKPAPVDVGEGYECVPDGTVITEDMEYLGHGDVWTKTKSTGSSDHGTLIYRRRKSPAVPDWAQRVIRICNRLWPNGECGALWRGDYVVYDSGDCINEWDKEPVKPYGGQSSISMAVSSEYWRERDAECQHDTPPTGQRG